jgi:biopolymer transport protein ExbD
VLLLQAEFAKVAIIEMQLPEGRGSQTQQTQKDRPKEDESNKLMLTSIITDSAITLGAKGGFLPSIWYVEFHHYISREGGKEITVRFNPKKKEETPTLGGRKLTIHERYDIWLYACDAETKEIMTAMYSQRGHLLTDLNGKPLEEVSVGDSAYVVTHPRHAIVIKDPSKYHLDSLSAYDLLKSRLMHVKDRFEDADDRDRVIIAAENEVLYDKIVQVMDAARTAGFPQIEIAKLRS